MKKIKVITLIFALAFFVSFTVNATGLSKEFSNYEIEEVEGLFLGKTAEKIWTLSYSADEVPVTVVKKKNLEGVNYVVRTEYFEVNYLCNGQGFGVREVKKGWSKVPKQITKAVVNKDEMERQRIISPNKVEDEKALGLIASYLPDLLNQGYTHLLN